MLYLILMNIRLLLLTAVLALGGCTSVVTYHNACTEFNHTIAQQVNCVHANVAQNPPMQDDTLVREYLMTGDALAGQVAAGQITEQAAQLRFQQKLNEIRRRELEEQALQAEISRANDRRFWNWGWPGDPDYCWRHPGDLRWCY